MENLPPLAFQPALRWKEAGSGRVVARRPFAIASIFQTNAADFTFRPSDKDAAQAEGAVGISRRRLMLTREALKAALAPAQPADDAAACEPAGRAKRRRLAPKKQGTGRTAHIRSYPLIFAPPAAPPEPASGAKTPSGLPSGSLTTSLKRKREWLYTPCEGVPERESYQTTGRARGSALTSGGMAFTPVEGVPERSLGRPQRLAQATSIGRAPAPRQSPAYSHVTYGNANSHLDYSEGAEEDDEEDGVNGPAGVAAAPADSAVTPAAAVGVAAAAGPQRRRGPKRDIEIQTGASICKDAAVAGRPAIVCRASMAIGTDDDAVALPLRVDTAAGPSGSTHGSGSAGAAAEGAGPSAAQHQGEDDACADDDGDDGNAWGMDDGGGEPDLGDDGMGPVSWQEQAGGSDAAWQQGYGDDGAGPSAAAVTPAPARKRRGGGGSNQGRRGRTDRFVSNRKSLSSAGLVEEGGARRSSRQRCKPLQWWMNDKKVFGREHMSLPTVVDIYTRTPNPAWPRDKPVRGHKGKHAARSKPAAQERGRKKAVRQPALERGEETETDVE